MVALVLSHHKQRVILILLTTRYLTATMSGQFISGHFQYLDIKQLAGNQCLDFACATHPPISKTFYQTAPFDRGFDL